MRAASLVVRTAGAAVGRVPQVRMLRPAGDPRHGVRSEIGKWMRSPRDRGPPGSTLGGREGHVP